MNNFKNYDILTLISEICDVKNHINYLTTNLKNINNQIIENRYNTTWYIYFQLYGEKIKLETNIRHYNQLLSNLDYQYRNLSEINNCSKKKLDITIGITCGLLLNKFAPQEISFGYDMSCILSNKSTAEKVVSGLSLLTHFLK